MLPGKTSPVTQLLFKTGSGGVPASLWELLHNIVNRYNTNTVLVDGCREEEVFVLLDTSSQISEKFAMDSDFLTKR